MRALSSAARSAAIWPFVVIVVLLFAATVAVMVGNAARSEASYVESAARSAPDVTVEAEVIEVARRWGHRAVVVRYDPPEGVPRALAPDGTSIPNEHHVYVGDPPPAEGQNVEVRLSFNHAMPMLDRRHHLEVADRLSTAADVLRGFAVLAYLVAAVLLADAVRQRDVPFIRAETASRHGGA